MGIMDIIIIPIFFLSLILCPGSSFNTPPHIQFTREWILTEDEPIGSVVTRIQVQDDDQDNVTITIGDPSSRIFQAMRQDGGSFFTIDSNHRVKVAKSLRGMAGETFLIGIIATDGHMPSRVDAKVIIVDPKKSMDKPPLHGFSSAFNPGPPPPSFHFSDNGYSQNSGPPLLHLDPYTIWRVPSNATVGHVVRTVEAVDLSNTFLHFSLIPDNLLHIDASTGKVTVAQPLDDKIGNHNLKVNVSDQFNYITEDVVLKVGAFNDLEDDNSEEDSDPSVSYYPSVTPRVQTSDTNSTPTITIIEKGLPAGVEDQASSRDKGTLAWTVVLAVIVIVVLLLMGVAFFCCWTKRRKLRASPKESSISYEKRGSIVHMASEHRDSIISGLFSMMRFHKRAESNGYEEDTKPPKVPNRESRKSAKSSNSLNSSRETDKWEFPRHKLRVLKILGEGCFGQVWQYEATDLGSEGTKFVAVKMLKESAGDLEQKDLLQELKVLKNIGRHPNVVSLLGCCTEKEPVFVILEYLVGGKLESFLRSSRVNLSYGNLHGGSSSLIPRDLTIFAFQVARGMDFLSKKGIIHRDLAARNILVGENKVCKVADFGFARDVANTYVYEKKSDGRLPIRWMAPESLFDNIYTTKSDVWSFGILLWEIVTLGSTPYPGKSAKDVMKFIKDGNRLNRPDHCGREIYNIMYYCWDADPNERPSFQELINSLDSLIRTEVDYIQLDNFPEHSYYNAISTSAELL